MTSYETLTVEQRDNQVVLLTLNRPDAANAINARMARELAEFYETAAADSDIRCIVMTGAGERAFCAGADLKERQGQSDEQWFKDHAWLEKLILNMRACPAPILAAVNGAAYGGGTELTLNSDFAYASDNARFALTETRLGIMPGAGGTQNAPRAMGTRRAMEMILSATPLSAEEAKDWGIVNRVFAKDALLEEALKTASAIASNAPLAVRGAKDAIWSATEMAFEDGLAHSMKIYKSLVVSEDRREGTTAFNEKRAAVFKGR